MKQLFKLYKFYLKKLLKSWYFWFFVVLGLLIVIGFPFFLYLMVRKNTSLSYKEFLKVYFRILGTKIQWTELKNNLPSFVTDFFFLSANSKIKDIIITSWKFFSWQMIGLLSVAFLTSSSIALLVSASVGNGEDKTILNVASPIKRDELVISKILAFLTLFLLGSLITFTIPYAFYYSFLIVFNTALVMFLLTSIFVFPLLHFLFFAAPLILFDLIASWLRIIFAALLVFSPVIWNLIKFYWGNKKFVIETGKIFGENFLVIAPLALLIGGSSLFAYRQLFQKKDFS